MTDPDLAAQLAHVLQPALGPVEIEGLVRLTGGASRATWSFDAVTGDGARTPLILQRDRGGGGFGPSFRVEDRLLAAAADAGVPVPEVIVDAAGCTPLGDARITRRLDGETLGPRIVRSDEFAAARAVLPGQLARAAAAIHSIPLEESLTAERGGVPEVDPIRQIRDGLDLLGVVSPAFELALQWLERTRPSQVRRTVVHGDFRIGNFLVDDTGLLAVLDWELAHLGDPVEDLGWLCVRAWRFGGDRVVGGIGDPEELLDAYNRASQQDVSAEHLRWWIVAGTLRWGLICAVQAGRHLSGQVRSVELATVGRRVAENEHDLLDLLDIPEHRDEYRLPVVDHGSPSAVELLAAVCEHLDGEVAPVLAKGDRFTLKVAVNALRIVERELRATPPPALEVDHVELAARLRNGEHPSDEDLAEIRAAVTARVAVANPGWAGID